MPDPISSRAMMSLAVQLISISDRPSQHSSSYNPRPSGSIQPGGATEAVLSFLRLEPRQFYTYQQILTANGHSKAAVDWALIFLRAQEYIETVPDTSRNSRYLRYRLIQVREKKKEGV